MPFDALHRAEARHQVIFQRKVKARRARVALAAGAPAQLVVDPARLVPFGADDMQAAELDHLGALDLGQPLGLFAGGFFLLGRGLFQLDALLRQQLLDQAIRVAAQQNVGAAAGHIGGDRHRAQPAGLRDNMRLALVLLGVQHRVLDAVAIKNRTQPLRGLDRGRADQHRPADLLHLLDLAHQRIELGLLGAVDLVVHDPGAPYRGWLG